MNSTASCHNCPHRNVIKFTNVLKFANVDNVDSIDTTIELR